jgi:hypothetical protein
MFCNLIGITNLKFKVMKTLLLITFLFLSSLLFGQKKLQSHVTLSYQNGNLINIDSVSYHYSAWQGSLYEFNVKQGFSDNGHYGFSLTIPLIPVDSAIYHYGSSYPLTTATNATGGNVYQINTEDVVNQVTNEYGGGESKDLYSYYPNGQVKNIIREFYNLGTLSSYDSIHNEYNNYGKKTSTAIYHNDLTSQYLFSTDTLNYDNSGVNMIRAVQYSTFGSSSSPIIVTERKMTYTANQLDYIDYWFRDFWGGANSLEYISRSKYVFNNSYLDNIKIYKAISGTLSSSHSNLILNYGYEVHDISLENGNIHSEEYSYDTDGFLISKANYSNIPNSISTRERFHFQSTLDLTEIEEIEVTIFPNPTSQFAEIKTAGQLKNVEVYNNKGQLLIRQNMHKIDLSKLESGPYVLIGQTDLGSFSKKIMKE